MNSVEYDRKVDKQTLYKKLSWDFTKTQLPEFHRSHHYQPQDKEPSKDQKLYHLCMAYQKATKCRQGPSFIKIIQ